VGPANTALPATEQAAEAPIQQNDITKPAAAATTSDGKKTKKPKADLSEDSSSKKKKKKGLDKLNPF
jgi:outer membrane protein assembly factor BamD